ncbi:MAG TPA: hypothetical protein VL137_06560 [Polyangiaceae bacterium]|nr:hypothetical protein [Polyangiaceae bacterium]
MRKWKRPRSLGFALPPLLALLAPAFGCGASFEAVYEGNVRFEHCYKLDHDPRIASSHREYCWSQWVQMYTYEQPLDRIEYARRRIRVLRGEPPPSTDRHASLPAAAASADPPATESLSTESLNAAQADPAPVSPVEAATASVVPAAPAPAPSAGSDVPGEECAAGCRTKLAECRKNCQTAPKGCAPCEPTYNSCMRTCYD